MNPNRLLQKNGLLTQQNNSLNTSLNKAVHRMRFIEQQLEEHKALLATRAKESGNVSGALALSAQLEEHKTLLSTATARALSAEKQLEEHKALLSNATSRALSAEKQLEEHKTLLSNATSRALSAEKQLQERVLEKPPPVENPPIYITRTRRG
jgi:putative protein kinase ArgK-like GTPase of G3E family